MALTDKKLVSHGQKLIESLNEVQTSTEKEIMVAEFLQARLTLENKLKIPDFDSDLEWLNCKEPLFFSGLLSGKLCVLDFFTYCCINCMHILPDLHALEKRHSVEDGLVVVGIHSAKFENEKSSENVVNAILRYNICHPVVNDCDAKLWYSLGVRCWPTLVLVGPTGEILLSIVGEGHRRTLLDFVSAALKYFKKAGQISPHDVKICLEKHSLPQSRLSFPGKICVDKSLDGRLIIADTGHHRVIVTTREGVVLHSIGDSTDNSPGFTDGDFQTARFNSPQGVAYMDEKIFVADTENHAIRQIDLKTELVSTIAGTGMQGNDKEGGKNRTQQSISSPWDVVLGPPPGVSPLQEEKEEYVLYIAMAGTHQIWALYLKDGRWFKGGSQRAGTCLRLAGSGAEENRNNSYPHKASFAQPSGLTLAVEKNSLCLYVADSESSAVRSVDLSTGATKALVGAERDPSNLFAFGDVDGKGCDAKLQHPLAVSWNPHSQLLFVADSYNHKIKVIDTTKKMCATFLGTGDPGSEAEKEVKFNEPGGMCVSADGQRLYVADTNNHVVRVIELGSKKVTKLDVRNFIASGVANKSEIKQSNAEDSQRFIKRLTSSRINAIRRELVHVCSSSPIHIKLCVEFPDAYHLNEGAKSRWQACFVDNISGELTSGESATFTTQNGLFTEQNMTAETTLLWQSGCSDSRFTLQLEAVVYYCEPSGTCRMSGFLYEIPIVRDENSDITSIRVDHRCTV